MGPSQREQKWKNKSHKRQKVRLDLEENTAARSKTVKVNEPRRNRDKWKNQQEKSQLICEKLIHTQKMREGKRERSTAYWPRVQVGHPVLGSQADLVHPGKSHFIAVSVAACCKLSDLTLISWVQHIDSKLKHGMCSNKKQQLQLNYMLPNGSMDYSMKSVMVL